MKYDIFVSYRRSDRELVAQVVRRLEERGASVWYDAEIEGGADWRDTIVEAISNSDMLVIFFSDACNQSRQLKKELAVADSLELPVVPILIEDTKPKGAYLYELADRNWLQAFPNPMSHIEDMVDHLIALAEKSPGGLDGTVSQGAPTEIQPEPSFKKSAPSTPSMDSGISADDAFASEEVPAAAPIIDQLSTRSSSHPSAKTSDYIGKKSEVNKRKRKLNDILPFKWIDLAFLIPLAGLTSWGLVAGEIESGMDHIASTVLTHAIFIITLIGIYGAIVFPVRYYMRKRRVWSAMWKYAISSGILYALTIGAFVAGDTMGLFPYDDPVEIAVVFGAFWIGLAVLAFIIYGILATQRQLRSFRSNIQKL